MLVALGLLGLIGLQIAVTNSSYLLHKYFWLDELCTYALLTDVSLVHAIRALRGTVEINPPGLNFMLLAYTSLTNSTSELALRSFALGTMILALVGVYAILREASYSVFVALAATLAVWCHPLILDHAFEVRYYGPWFAAAIWFCYLLARTRALALGSWGTVALALSSLVLCTVHYFGVLTLIIIVASEWLWQRGRLLYGRKHLAAIALGPLVIVGFAIFFLPYQKAIMTVPTWIPNPTPASIADLAMTLFLPLHLGAVVMVAWFSQLWPGGNGPDGLSTGTAYGTSGLIALTSLVLVLPMLIAISYLVQPVLVSRYGITAIAGIAPAVAHIMSRMKRIWLILLIGFFAAASAHELHQRSLRAREDDARTQELIHTIREHAGNSPVLFEAPHQLFVVWHYAADLRRQVFLLDFETDQFSNNVSRFRVFARDLARQFAKFYAAPGLMAWDQVRHANSVYLVPHHQVFTKEPLPHQRYPQFIMTPVHGRLHRLVQKAVR